MTRPSTSGTGQDPGRAILRATAGLGLLRLLPDGAWQLTPLAGRYRDADLSHPAPADTLFPEDA